MPKGPNVNQTLVVCRNVAPKIAIEEAHVKLWPQTGVEPMTFIFKVRSFIHYTMLADKLLSLLKTISWYGHEDA